MRNRIVFLVIVFGFAFQGIAGVIHESKSTVKFKGLGQYSTHDLIFIQGMKQYKESSGTFKGEGMVGQIMSGLLFGDKSKGEITDLQAMKVIELFKEKHQYSEHPIEKIQLNMNEEQNEQTEAQEQTGETDNAIKIIRQELRVVPTHKSKTIHNFPCREYQVFWITEWENTETGEKGKDSLFTDVWATQKTASIKKGLQEELNFQKVYLQKVGLKVDPNSQSILGLNWIKMFQNMKHGQAGKANFNETKWIEELKKIKGYPVVIDGEFYVSSSKSKKIKSEKENENFDFTNPTGMFGNLLKKSARKTKGSKSNKKEPAFAYHTELIKIEVKPISENKFKVPAGYQKIN